MSASVAELLTITEVGQLLKTTPGAARNVLDRLKVKPFNLGPGGLACAGIAMKFLKLWNDSGSHGRSRSRKESSSTANSSRVALCRRSLQN